MDCKTLRNDEIEALSAIYGEEWVAEDESNHVFSIELKDQNNCLESQPIRGPIRSIHLEFRLPEEYPLSQPPLYTLSAPWMSRRQKSLLTQELEEIYCSNESQSILYLWIEKAREFLSSLEENDVLSEDIDCQNECLQYNDQNLSESTKETKHEIECEHSSYNTTHSQPMSSNNSGSSGQTPALYHGEPLTDRRSTFQAHLSPVHSVTEAMEALTALKSNKKISTATHNISAYRISGGPHNTCLQDCDDDGESHAGSRLLHLLQILEVRDVLVVVSRWFGGIQLGPDRFKHINNVARDLLLKCGYIDGSNDSNSSNQSVKHKKKAK